MKKIFLLLLILFFVGCIQNENKLGFSTKEISIEMGKEKLINAERVGVIINKKSEITQNNFKDMIECANGFSFSLGAKGKDVYVYGIEGDECVTDHLNITTIQKCFEHIKENDYNIHILGGEAKVSFYEDNMEVYVPEGKVIKCEIN